MITKSRALDLAHAFRMSSLRAADIRDRFDIIGQPGEADHWDLIRALRIKRARKYQALADSSFWVRLLWRAES